MTTTQIKLIVTDRFDLSKLNFKNITSNEVIITRLSIEEARFQVMESKSYHVEFHLMDNLCKMACESILECDLKINKNVTPLFDDSTNYLVVAFDNNIEPIFYLIS